MRRKRKSSGGFLRAVVHNLFFSRGRYFIIILCLVLFSWLLLLFAPGNLSWPGGFGGGKEPEGEEDETEDKLYRGYWLKDGSEMERKEVDDPHLYTYFDMVDDLRDITEQYSEITGLTQVGHSVEGVPLWCIKVGRGNKDILVVGAAHAREWITTPVLVEQARTYAGDYYQEGNELSEKEGMIKGVTMQKLLEEYKLWFIPMLNPDGVRLAQKGPSLYPERKEELLSMNKSGMGDDFTRWKANIRGVDLNRQYNVNWEETLELAHVESQREVRLEPSYQNHLGEEPYSEPESRAVAQLLKDEDRDFRLGLDYHSTGQFIFWYYGQEGEHLEVNRRMVREMSDYSGYGKMATGSFFEPNTCLVRYMINKHELPGATVEIAPFTTGIRDMRDFEEAVENNRYMVPVAVSALPSFEEIK